MTAKADSGSETECCTSDLNLRILIILDNASIHKKADILEKIAKEMPNIVLEFLPPYSPDYNLIELVWHSAKEFIANRLFESIEDLEALVHSNRPRNLTKI